VPKVKSVVVPVVEVVAKLKMPFRLMFSKREVEDALMPLCAKRTDEVAAFIEPKLESQVNGAAPAEVWSVAQLNAPADQVRYCPADAAAEAVYI
jgi:hypothetical protein